MTDDPEDSPGSDGSAGDDTADGADGVGDHPDTGERDPADLVGSADDGAGDATSTADATPSRSGETDTRDVWTTSEPRTISPRVRYIWGLRMLVGVGLLTLGTAWISGAIRALPRWTAPVVGLVLLAVGVAWVHRRYTVWVYEVRPDSLYLERGVVTHVRTIAPFVRIQHVDTQRGPLERWLGLSTLVVYTAGSRGADVSIPGLSPHEARDLQARVKELAIEAEGGDAV